MSRYTLLAACVLALGLQGCNEITSPLSENFDARKLSTFETTSGGTADADVVGAVYDFDVPPGTLSHLSDAPALETYRATFTVIQGQDDDLFVRYARGGHWFMKLNIPEDAQFVDSNGVPLADGDTLVVTADIHPTLFFVKFGPHGSTFTGSRGAALSYNLRYADLTGHDMENVAVWYQPTTADPWSSQPTTVDMKNGQVSMELRHFSNYAVAW